MLTPPNTPVITGKKVKIGTSFYQILQKKNNFHNDFMIKTVAVVWLSFSLIQVNREACATFL